MKREFLLIIFFLISCSPSPTEIWLEEYRVVLQKGADIFAKDPYSLELQEVQYEIAEKEAEVDGLLRNVSMQEKINFLSKYYDMRVNYYYSAKN